MEVLGTMLMVLIFIMGGYYLCLMVHYGDQEKYYNRGKMAGHVEGSMEVFEILKPIMEEEMEKIEELRATIKELKKA